MPQIIGGADVLDLKNEQMAPHPGLPENVIALAGDYPSLISGLVARRRELGLSQRDIDEIAGLTSNYVSKIECGMKGLGRMSLDALLGALGLELALVRTTPHHVRQKRLMSAPRGRTQHDRRAQPATAQ